MDMPVTVVEQNRRCRDIIFLLFFLAFLVGMAVIAAWSIQYGAAGRVRDMI